MYSSKRQALEFILPVMGNINVIITGNLDKCGPCLEMQSLSPRQKVPTIAVNRVTILTKHYSEHRTEAAVFLPVQVSGEKKTLTRQLDLGDDGDDKSRLPQMTVEFPVGHGARGHAQKPHFGVAS